MCPQEVLRRLASFIFVAGVADAADGGVLGQEQA